MAVPSAINNRVDGTGNPFAGMFGNQCTYWAQQRYHDMTGIWTPCTGNGYQWASEAAFNGWIVSGKPPNVPSIICLQPGVQGADASFGHVGVVERINSDGSVYTSNYNVYPNIGNKVTTYRTFYITSGISFIYAGNNIGSLNNLVNISNTIKDTVTNIAKTYTLSSNSTVADTLVALDHIMDINNPFENISATQDSLGPINFTDPISWLQAVAMNTVSDIVALTMRAFFLALGVFLFFKVIDHFVNFSEIANNVGQTAGQIAPLILAG